MADIETVDQVQGEPAPDETPQIDAAGETNDAPAEETISMEEMLVQAGLDGSTKTEAETPTQEAPADAEEPPDEPKPMSQAQLNELFGKRAAEERRRVQRGEEYQLGQLLLQQRMQDKSIDKAEALKQLRDEAMNARVAELAKDPTAMAKALLHQQMPTQTDEAPDAPSTQTSTETRELARATAEAVSESIKAGRLPNDFNPENAKSVYPEFIADIRAYGAAAAVKIAEAKVAASQNAQIATNRALPKPIAPRSGKTPGGVNIAAMSSKDFAKLDQVIDEQVRAGRRVSI